MILKSISALLLMLIGASVPFNNAPIALAFAPSSSLLQHRSPLLTDHLVSSPSPAFVLSLNASTRKEDYDDAGARKKKEEYESPPPKQRNQSRRDLFESLPSAAAALTAATTLLGGGAAEAGAFLLPRKRRNKEDEEIPRNTFIGPLNELVGKWEGNQGFVLISVPAPGKNPKESPPSFDILSFPYRETFEIEALDGGTENRGGSIDQLNGVCTYTKTVWAIDEKHPDAPEKVIHKEDGMFFYLDPVTTNPGGNPVSSEDKPPFAIGRSAVIPHGNTAMIFGDVTKFEGPPSLPDIDPTPFTTPATAFLNGYFEGARSVDKMPNTKLQDGLKNGPSVLNTVQFSMSSTNGTGGILNTDFITKRSDTREYKVDMWVEDLGNNQKQLQYAETASIFFHFNQNLEVNWPHVMVNTLTKKVD